MIKAHHILKTWIDKNFKCVSIKFNKDGSATIIDSQNGKMTVSLNLYCDIVEVETKKLLAISNLSHQIDKVGNAIPTTWREIPYTSAKAFSD